MFVILTRQSPVWMGLHEGQTRLHGFGIFSAVLPKWLHVAIHEGGGAERFIPGLERQPIEARNDFDFVSVSLEKIEPVR